MVSRSSMVGWSVVRRGLIHRETYPGFRLASRYVTSLHGTDVRSNQVFDTADSVGWVSARSYSIACFMRLFMRLFTILSGHRGLISLKQPAMDQVVHISSAEKSSGDEQVVQISSPEDSSNEDDRMLFTINLLHRIRRRRREERRRWVSCNEFWTT